MSLAQARDKAVMKKEHRDQRAQNVVDIVLDFGDDEWYKKIVIELNWLMRPFCFHFWCQNKEVGKLHFDSNLADK